jgi:GTP-binding protein EngB required for normal cell division
MSTDPGHPEMSQLGEPRDLSEYDQAKLELASIVRFAAEKAPRDAGLRPREYTDFFARLAEDRFNLSLLGRFNRGKTSLMNAIIGSDRLPTGVVPLTSVITSVSYGSTEQVQLELERGSFPIEIRMSELEQYVTERGNPGNSRGIREARIRLPAEILRRGYYFVDTPGLGSAIVENTRTSLSFLRETDALVLVSSYESPLSEEELRVLEAMARGDTQVFLVLNKQDGVEPTARREVTTFVEQRLQSLFGDRRPAVFSISAKLALAAKLEGNRERLEETGLPALERALTNFLVAHKNRQFLERMIARARELIERMPEEDGTKALKVRLGRLKTTQGPPIEWDVPGIPRSTARIGAGPVRLCDLCERINQNLFEFLCHFQHAVVTDAGELERFVVAQGFCTRHFWLYFALAAPRDVCVALSPLLKALSAQFQQGLSESHPSTPHPATCRMCTIQERLESETIAAVGSQTVSPDSTLPNAPSLCVPHLRLVVERLDNTRLATALCAEHARGFERLAEDMQRYALKHDALRRYLTSEEERDAAEDAMHRIAGRRLINR